MQARSPRPATDDPATRVVGHCLAYVDGGGEVPLDQAIALAHGDRGFVWVDLPDPEADEFAQVAQALDLPGPAAEDAVGVHQRPKLEVYRDVLFLVIKPVVYTDPGKVIDVGEVALFIGPRFVVSVRHGQSAALDEVRAVTGSADGPTLTDPIDVLHRIVDLVVDGYQHAVAGIGEDVDEIESLVFADATDELDDHSERIYRLKREIAGFRRAVVPLAAALQRLTDHRTADLHLGPDQRVFLRDVHDHALHAADAIDAQDRLLSDVLQADFARLAARQGEIAGRQNEISVRQNEDMRKISAWAAIGLVPTAIAGIYGMNFADMPELKWHYGYPAALALMLASCTVLYVAFRRNGWL